MRDRTCPQLCLAPSLEWWRPGRRTDHPAGPRWFMAELSDGLRFVHHDCLLRRLWLSTAGFLVCNGALSGLLVVFTASLLHAGPSGLGLVLSGLGAGGLLG